MKIWIAHARTEATDHYYFAYAYEPSRKEVQNTMLPITYGLPKKTDES